ncbi:MAG: hypothetical protein LBD33_01885 [Puniceicoccales bacterium]|nr:hypothetical protein [Puniceicoccales bacterium]
MAPEDPGQIEGGRLVVSVPARRLDEHIGQVRQILEIATGLNARLCAKLIKFSPKEVDEVREAKKVFQDLGRGRCNPGCFKKFLLQWGWIGKGSTPEQRIERFRLRQLLKESSFRKNFIANAGNTILSFGQGEDEITGVNFDKKISEFRQLLGMISDALTNFPDERRQLSNELIRAQGEATNAAGFAGETGAETRSGVASNSLRHAIETQKLLLLGLAEREQRITRPRQLRDEPFWDHFIENAKNVVLRFGQGEPLIPGNLSVKKDEFREILGVMFGALTNFPNERQELYLRLINEQQKNISGSRSDPDYDFQHSKIVSLASIFSPPKPRGPMPESDSESDDSQNDEYWQQREVIAIDFAAENH